MGTITELAPFTNYSCTILATTVLPGPMSDPIYIRTLELGIVKNYSGISFKGHNTFSLSIKEKFCGPYKTIIMAI